MKTGAELIADERKRGIEVEGFTAEHDDQHTHGELSAAADSYRIYADAQEKHGTGNLPTCFIPKQWPWGREWWKPNEDIVRNLVRAGALYQAQADFCKRHGQTDMAEVCEQFCVRLIAERIDRLQTAKAIGEGRAFLGAEA